MKAAFFDRDGVINKDIGYLHKWEDFEYEKYVKTSLLKLIDANYQLILVTNQSGIARGYYTEEDFKLLTSRMRGDLKKLGIDFLDIFYCPHYLNGNVKEYTIDCDCRKPKPGLFFQAFEKYDIDKTKSVMFGDKNSDIKAAFAAGIRHRFLVNNSSYFKIKPGQFDTIKEAVDSFLS